MVELKINKIQITENLNIWGKKYTSKQLMGQKVISREIKNNLSK